MEIFTAWLSIHILLKSVHNDWGVYLGICSEAVVSCQHINVLLPSLNMCWFLCFSLINKDSDSTPPLETSKDARITNLVSGALEFPNPGLVEY